MRKLFFLIFIAFNSHCVMAQPGYRIVDIPTSGNEVYLNSYGDYHFRIDSNTNFANLKYLNKLHSIIITVDVKTLPKEFYLLLDSLKAITIDGNDKLFDISALKRLVNLESIKIENYAGTRLPDLAALTKLKSFEIQKYYGGDKLKSINGLDNCKALKTLYIQSGSLDDFNLNMGQMNIEDLTLSRCSSLTNINGISNSKTIKKLSLEELPLEKLPENMEYMKNLESVNLFEMTKLADISTLKQMKNLRKVYIYGAFELREIPKNFSTNIKIDTIHIEYSRNLKSAEGIANLNDLSVLSIEDVNEGFLIPSNISSCMNLQSIKMDININTKNQVKDISMIKNLIKLKKLYLGRCPFSVLPNEIYSNVNIEDLTVYADKVITDLSGVVKLKNLKKLEIMYNGKLIKIPNLNEMLFIESVRIHDNKSLKIPDDYYNVKKNWLFAKNANN